jgi:hypothetical protein
MKPHLVGVALLAALCAGAACNRSVKTPTGPTTGVSDPAPSPPAQVIALIVTGNVSLGAIGETSQLTARATMSDGSIKDVTSAAQWTSEDVTALTVTPGGLVTVVRYGRTFVRAAYAPKSGGVAISATPSGTSIVWGRVREPGNSGVGGVRVVEPVSGMSTTSDGQGSFTIGALTALRLTFEKDGFENTAFTAKAEDFADISVQRVMRIAPGATVTTTLAPHDMDYTPVAGSRCYPCRMIRVAVPQTGAFQARLTWTEPKATLSLWINGQVFGGTEGSSELLADVSVVAGELLIYAGMATPKEVYVPLTLSIGTIK